MLDKKMAATPTTTTTAMAKTTFACGEIGATLFSFSLMSKNSVLFCPADPLTNAHEFKTPCELVSHTNMKHTMTSRSEPLLLASLDASAECCDRDCTYPARHRDDLRSQSLSGPQQHSSLQQLLADRPSGEHQARPHAMLGRYRDDLRSQSLSGPQQHSSLQQLLADRSSAEHQARLFAVSMFMAGAWLTAIPAGFLLMTASRSHK